MKSGSGSIKARGLAAPLEQVETAGKETDFASADRLLGKTQAQFDVAITFLRDALAQ